ncbi:MAG: LLM class flavin-dependent oxidoreductase [Deltaproteobacteria bacterium]|nr:LLM class flavin-dependent oxidoreductase [Deltaproteobacteria bacterium]MBM4297907.1 LLM class flavin-dependent oxidoreductase [Deltaproteobacteria bacterium]
MNIGLLLHTRQLIRAEDAAQSFEHLWADAAQAEELGFDHIWLGDSVTVLDKARGDCLTTMSAVAAKTKKIRLGIVPMLPALRNPVLLAHALATIDVISNGRLILGVSVGPTRDYIQRQFAACGVPPTEKAGRLGETLEIMRRLWCESKIDFDGRYFKLHDVGILPHPAQQPGIPIWIAADRNENGFKRVGRLGDGWVTLLPTVEQFSAARKKIDGQAKAFAREGAVKATALYATFNIHNDKARAQDEGWQWMERFFEQPLAKLAYHSTNFCTPNECVALLKSYAAAGVTDIVARIASDDVRGQARMLLQQIKPRL